MPPSPSEPAPQNDSRREIVYRFIAGMCMGAADVVPGVSGGTMAFVLGVYDRLIQSIRNVNADLVRKALRFDVKAVFEHLDWKFLLPLGLGILASIITLSHGVHWALENARPQLFAFFFGLIIASLISLAAHIRWNAGSAVGALVGVVVGYLIIQLVPVDMPNSPLVVVLSAAIAVCAMILPGISGSFLLLILGQYDYIITAIKGFDLKVIALVGVGAVVGLLSFSKLLGWLLDRARNLVIAVMTGFILGSAPKIWPFRTVLEEMPKGDEMVVIKDALRLPQAGEPWLLCLSLGVAGFVVLSALDHFHSRSNPVFSLFRKSA